MKNFPRSYQRKDSLMLAEVKHYDHGATMRTHRKAQRAPESIKTDWPKKVFWMIWRKLPYFGPITTKIVQFISVETTDFFWYVCIYSFLVPVMKIFNTKLVEGNSGTFLRPLDCKRETQSEFSFVMSCFAA